MQTEGENYSVRYERDKVMVKCVGCLDLRGKEGYGPIAELFGKVIEQHSAPSTLILDLRDLEFLNSSGITTIGGFIIKIRNKGGVGLRILCADRHTWQGRSMRGLQKLMEGVEIVFE